MTYDQVTRERYENSGDVKDAIDEAFSRLSIDMKALGFNTANDDRAEECVMAMFRYYEQSQAKQPLCGCGKPLNAAGFCSGSTQ